ncbi:MAG: hypothetical protein KatS3mg087_1522 [Patescibacteria group bacterium]|nr:MAG: hypothetical protein KatS3mg087_1522 [Patescibacteria group bacterium]
MTYKLVKIKNHLINEIHLLLFNNQPVNIRKLMEENIIQTETIAIPQTEEDFIISVDINEETLMAKIEEWKNETEAMPNILQEVLKTSQSDIRQYDISAFPRILKTNNERYKLCILKINEIEKLQQILISNINHYLTRIVSNPNDIHIFTKMWEDFVISNMEYEIEILDNTQENWEKIFNPKIAPIQTCLTKEESYQKIAKFYTSLPEARPCLIKRKNNNKIIGRTIIWETKHYGLCHDKIYTSLSNQDKIIRLFEQMNINNIYQPTLYMPTAFIGTIKLTKKNKPLIPYMDTFRLFAWIHKDKRRKEYTFIISNLKESIYLKAQEYYELNPDKKVEQKIKIHTLKGTIGHLYLFEE